MNKVTATGVLVRAGRGERGYSEITLMIGKKGQTNAFVKFVLETTISPEIQPKDVIDVEGYIRGYQARNEKGNWYVDQYFVATNIKKAVGEMQQVFGVRDHFSPNHDFKCYISGRVNSVLQTSEKFKSLYISIDGNREVPDIIAATIRDNVRFNEFKELKKGDTIVTRMSVWTPRKNINGEMKSFEDLVIEDIGITNREISQVVQRKPKEETNKKQSAENQFEETEE